MIEVVLIYLAAINIITFAMYGIDKKRAIKDQWRIPEKTLLGAAFIGGSLGALAGMKAFRHKTKHGKFKVLIPVFLMMHIAIFVYFTGEAA